MWQKRFDTPRRRWKHRNGRAARVGDPAENTTAPAAPAPRAASTVATDARPHGRAAALVDLGSVAGVRRRTPGANETLPRTAAAIGAPPSRPAAWSSATTARAASKDGQGSTHVRAVAVCGRMLAGRRRHYFFVFRKVHSSCPLLGLCPREVIEWRLLTARHWPRTVLWLARAGVVGAAEPTMSRRLGFGYSPRGWACRYFSYYVCIHVVLAAS